MSTLELAAGCAARVCKSSLATIAGMKRGSSLNSLTKKRVTIGQTVCMFLADDLTVQCEQINLGRSFVVLLLL